MTPKLPTPPSIYLRGTPVTALDLILGTGCQLILMEPGGTGTAPWPSANLAIYAPIELARPVTVTALFSLIANAAGTMELGIYNAARKRIITTGAFTPTANSYNLTAITPTLLPAGLYFLACVCTNTGLQTSRFQVAAINAHCMGFRSEASAAPLPATATFAAPPANYLPYRTGLLTNGYAGSYA